MKTLIRVSVAAAAAVTLAACSSEPTSDVSSDLLGQSPLQRIADLHAVPVQGDEYGDYVSYVTTAEPQEAIPEVRDYVPEVTWADDEVCTPVECSQSGRIEIRGETVPVAVNAVVEGAGVPGTVVIVTLVRTDNINNNQEATVTGQP